MSAGKVTDSSGSIFADLHLPNPVEEDTKMDLAVAINEAIVERGLRQADAAKVIAATQPQVSALKNYKLSGFSIGRLVDFLAALDRDVEIGWRRSDRRGHVRVRQLAPIEPA